MAYLFLHGDPKVLATVCNKRYHFISRKCDALFIFCHLSDSYREDSFHTIIFYFQYAREGCQEWILTHTGMAMRR